MDKSNLELFKQALNEGVGNKFDKMAAECTEEIVYSDKHKLAMRTIVYGKTETKRAWSPKMKRIIAILIAAALLLTGCGIIFRNEIREIFKEFFVSLTYDSDDESSDNISEIYTLGYLPEGYYLETETITPIRAQYKFVNKTSDFLYFEQRALTLSDYCIDSESGYSRIVEIEEYDVYCRHNNENYLYVWSIEQYFFNLTSNQELSAEEITLIIEGITSK